tara:strand:- start:171 stop:365 length:195 start_codon:yes stop_codon:yes gene_type:complete
MDIDDILVDLVVCVNEGFAGVADWPELRWISLPKAFPKCSAEDVAAAIASAERSSSSFLQSTAV